MYTLQSRIRYSECDENGALSLVALINYLQDCTTFNSEDIGRGVAYMKERSQAWLIAAWQIHIDRLPRFSERINVSTWCPKMTHTLASRNFVIDDDQGQRLVSADSLWFVFDQSLERPVKIPEEQLVYLSDEEPLDLPPTRRRLPMKGDYVTTEPITVAEAHLDSNRHVNNAQYLAMATSALTSTFGPEIATSAIDIARIDIQYKRQAFLGDTVVPRLYLQEENACTVELAAVEGDSFAIIRIERR